MCRSSCSFSISFSLAVMLAACGLSSAQANRPAIPGVVNALDFGATANSVADDTVAIRKAIDSL